jgi:DNA-directed RNA polymerase subunit RPC12/RpoP
MPLSSEQEEIIRLIRELWSKTPEQRFGQVLENYVFYQGQRGDKTSVRLFHQQDSETLAILRNQIKRPKALACPKCGYDMVLIRTGGGPPGSWPAYWYCENCGHKEEAK